MNSSDGNKLVVNELLFFIQNKLHATTKDEIVEMCAKFYSLDEINNSVSTIESVLNTRLSKRHKADDLQLKLVADLYDKLWSLDAQGAGTQIPMFVAADLARIPRERENTESLASTEQLLSSVHNLKSIVYQLQSKMVTREFLESSLANLGAGTSTRPSPALASLPASTLPPSSNPTPSASTLPPSLSSNPTPSASSLNSLSSASAPPLGSSLAFPPLPSLTPSAPLAPLSPSAPIQVPPSSVNAASIVATGLGTQQRNLNKNYPRRKEPGKAAKSGGKNSSSSVIIGKSVNAGIMSWRGADLTVARYIGHVALGTTAEEIRTSLQSRDVDVVSLDAIVTKHNRFLSFKLVVKKSQLELIDKADVWPDGVVIGRWWSPKPPTAGSVDETPSAAASANSVKTPTVVPSADASTSNFNKLPS